MNSTEGTDAMDANAMNALYTQRRKNTDNLYQASDFNGEACKAQTPMSFITGLSHG